MAPDLFDERLLANPSVGTRFGESGRDDDQRFDLRGGALVHDAGDQWVGDGDDREIGAGWDVGDRRVARLPVEVGGAGVDRVNATRKTVLAQRGKNPMSDACRIARRAHQHHRLRLQHRSQRRGGGERHATLRAGHRVRGRAERELQADRARFGLRSNLEPGLVEHVQHLCVFGQRDCFEAAKAVAGGNRREPLEQDRPEPFSLKRVAHGKRHFGDPGADAEIGANRDRTEFVVDVAHGQERHRERGITRVA